ncbi:MAG: hypothetical protein JSV83_20525 [Desulfobacterales bacterium]|nr:MAG: hypothetical protein JSV83_20525 [Desulfobacterales bacterium]
MKKLSGRGCSGIPCAADEPGRDAQRWFSFMEKTEMEIVSEEFRALWDLIYLLEEREQSATVDELKRHLVKMKLN